MGVVIDKYLTQPLIIPSKKKKTQPLIKDILGISKQRQ